ncbi:zinc-binding dehydrogenase [Companilactobacillus futsaii]|uniref:Zinc-binding dehydrogenase n=2 Tax=Companilactobacillus futsaii TaxID=938155 RepID=A0A5B7T2B5_9LACO|nr:zinc-binding dehydrogenase [Companilactobacillus futsaii]KRK90841.1 alcohol dehydrogenase [Companilactobacillus futsaii JCM 17355]QCX24425.1 zinc-binding dehydrogenase [Companilactobacillus futsaii]
MKALTITKDKTNISDAKIIQVAKPTTNDAEILIKVKAVGLNPVDYKLIENHPSNWTDPHILGLDTAGEIVEVGADNPKDFKVGQRVFFHSDLNKNGVYAEYAKAKYNIVARIPDNVSYQSAAAILCSGLTAYASIFRKMNLTGKKNILIHAGAGGVGSIGVQLAKYLGLTVITTVSTKKVDFVKKIGADFVIDYKKQNTSEEISKITNGVGVDLIINLVGGIEVQKDLSRLAYNGAVVDILNTPDLSNYDLTAKGQSVLSVNLGGAHNGGNINQLNDLSIMAESLVKLVSEGVVDPLITKEISFEEITDGLQLIKDHQTEGKIVAVLD